LLLPHGHFHPRLTYLVTFVASSHFLHSYTMYPSLTPTAGLGCSRSWLGILRIVLILVTQLLRDSVPLPAHFST
jgi:hypothetical protein